MHNSTDRMESCVLGIFCDLAMLTLEVQQIVSVISQAILNGVVKSERIYSKLLLGKETSIKNSSNF